MTAQPGTSSEDFRTRWHETPRELAAVLRDIVRAQHPPSIRRVFTFVLKPGVLGGFYAVSFVDGDRTVHRCVFAYSQAQRLQWEVRPLEEICNAFALVSVDGRIEIGQNTGDLLEYFLPNVEDGDPVAVVEVKRRNAYRAWLRASGEQEPSACAIRVATVAQSAPVYCCTVGRAHLLIRADPSQEKGATPTLPRAGDAQEIPFESSLYRDIMGEWKAS